MALVYTGLLLYQRALLQSAADMAAEKGAAAWSRHGGDLATGKISASGMDDQGLYWRIYDTDKNGALEKIKNYARNLSEDKSLMHSEDSTTDAVIRDYIIYKRLEVTIENRYHIPLGGFLKLFGANDHFTIKVTAYSVIDDPTELIRNTDFIIDVEKELEDKFPSLQNLGEKTRDAFTEIKGKLADFLN
jgi:hypothetical protein